MFHTFFWWVLWLSVAFDLGWAYTNSHPGFVPYDGPECFAVNANGDCIITY